MTNVLVVSKDSSLKKTITQTMKHNDFKVQNVNESTQGWKLMRKEKFDFVMIDMNLKDESGLAFYKSIRQFGDNTPVLMIGECDFDTFMLKDLAIENYDYMIKPFKLNELQNKVNTLLERISSPERIVELGDMKIDIRHKVVFIRDSFVQLTEMEIQILLLFAHKAGEIIHPKKIKKLLEIEGVFYGMSTIYYVSKLRGKMKKIAGDAFDISWIKDEGYLFKYNMA